MGGKRHGKNGEDVVLGVPVGTEVRLVETSAELIGDVMSAGERLLVARGGRGGRGNARFVSATEQFPLLAEEGEAGEDVDLRLDLKLVADVGIVGSPNAGKSTLLGAITGARPKVADYPFTTVEPVLGVAEHRNESYVLVEIPGLIEGAHRGVGLGHEFLRHVERAQVLVHVVDGTLHDVPEEVDKVNRELLLFDERLTTKQQIVAVNKVDVPGVREKTEAARATLRELGEEVHLVSAAGRIGLEPLLDSMVQALAVDRGSEKGRATGSMPVVRPRPRRARVRVMREDGTYVVTGGTASRIAGMLDESNWTAWMQFMRHLGRTGVLKALEKAGIRSGDRARVGKIEWEWQ